MKAIRKTNIPNGFPFSGQTCFLEGSSNLKDYLHGGFFDENRDNNASIILKRLIKKYGIPECGRNRATFISKKFVIKFPLNDEGEINNSIEASFFSDKTAKGRKITLNEFICIVQEKITILKYPVEMTNLPDWTKSIDSCQVGYDSSGKLKAYDFAEDIDKIKVKKIKP